MLRAHNTAAAGDVVIGTVEIIAEVQALTSLSAHGPNMRAKQVRSRVRLNVVHNVGSRPTELAGAAWDGPSRRVEATSTCGRQTRDVCDRGGVVIANTDHEPVHGPCREGNPARLRFEVRHGLNDGLIPVEKFLPRR
jgi:hypothetical protein